MKYRVASEIHHNNEKYFEGQEVELSLQEAGPLIELKAIEPIIKPFSQNSLVSNSSD